MIILTHGGIDPASKKLGPVLIYPDRLNFSSSGRPVVGPEAARVVVARSVSCRPLCETQASARQKFFNYSIILLVTFHDIPVGHSTSLVDQV